MFKIPTFCFIHKFLIYDVIKEQEIWCKKISGKTIEGSEYKRTIYKVKYKCKYCSKAKYVSYYFDETDKNILVEFDFWLKENTKKE